MDILIQALTYINLNAILAIIAATAFGLFVGAIPGLTATMAVALMVPFTFFLDPIPALALMIAVGASSIYAGDIPGALLRIPGTPASAAYVADSNELVKQGKVNRVLGLGLVSSVIGGVIGSLILMLAAPVLAKFALKFSSYEYTWLSLLGLTCATLVVGNQPLKGMVTLCLGLLLACIGYDQISGVPRFTFGQISLLQGVNFIPAMIGLFAISGAIEYYRDKISQVSGAVPQTQTGINLFKGMRQVIWSRKLNLGRSSIIGTLIGALPGAGADIAAWISYAISKKFSRQQELYGHGSEEAIVDSSSSNNASLAGSWIPSLVFGIPGDSAAAIIIGVLYMKDMNPGPTLFLFQADKLYAVFILFLIANIALLPLATIAVSFIKRIIWIDKAILYPIILIFSIVGAFAIDNSGASVVVMLVMGVLGYWLQRKEYPVSPIILGMILGLMLEKNLLSSMIKSNSEWLAFVERPVSMALAACFFLVVALQGRNIYRSFSR
ncbi:tripartite tricarboxylate transporter permease [Escherichia fergusonii]|uniref:tripartite tricarboxylate transporter permease n=1 Tax=Escherichia fergusonii TaxID=564 RepID=UPI0013621D44|nr:tripartite tricarboxylate transporter permease [Escherichia fergusonii]EHG6001830.1 tripartite tricarboxylate transporter permease [Escherichia fergusonii]MCZ5216754.1 tripartite tricarboxylate transporter permease [Escherichia fergusonii]NVP66425.1 tripartite tricarboxylate transporter permease [Escherichia fergusonii]